MKLYTEEQVRTFRKWQREWDFYDKDPKPTPKPLTFDEYLDSLTPIELPSDEEIEEQSKKFLLGSQVWEKGAKWIKEQILNQNK